MNRIRFTSTLALTLLATYAVHCGQASAQIQKNDVVVGTNSNQPDSFAIVRAGAGAVPGVTELGGEIAMATPWERNFIQSVTFDHANGNMFNANGNLLGANFGGGFTGFEVFNFATNGSGNFESLWGIRSATETEPGANDGITTRGGGISVSPDNTKIAWSGADGGQIHVLSYDAGPTPGTGSGASVNGWIQTTEGDGFGNPGGLAPLSNVTQGTTWVDNNTMLALNGFGELVRLDVSGISFGTTSAPATTSAWTIAKDGIFFDSPGNAGFTSLYYNQDVAPDYVIGAAGFFVGGVSTSEIFVWDRDTLDQVAKVDISGTAQTVREVALDSDGNLYVSTHANVEGSRTELVSVINDFVGRVGAGTITDDSSVKWFNLAFPGSDPPTGPSFSGLTVATSGEEVIGIPGDFDGDGIVDGHDLLAWQRGETPGGGSPAELASWEANFGSGAPLSAIAAVPEPGSLALLAFACAAMALRRGR